MTELPYRSTDRVRAEAMDAADPLAHFRARYLPLPPDVAAYFDGNSLGRPLISIADRWALFAHEQWAGRLIRGWSDGWMELPEAVGNELGAAALGAAPGQTVIGDSTTVLFYKTLRAALDLQPDRRRIVLDRDNFPTDRYVAESLAVDLGRELVWITAAEHGGVTAADLEPVLDDSVAVVTLSHVAYRSGALADLAGITALAHRHGALVVWDLSHSVGSTPVDLDAAAVDFAVGCTYKFVGAGPGAPAFGYVNQRLHGRFRQPIWGWLGRADAFEMAQDYVPANGVKSLLSGTPPVLGMLAVREGAAVIAEAGLDEIRAKAVALTSYAEELCRAWLLPAGFALASPPADRRGAHLSIARADAKELCTQLIEAGVIPDFRTPDVIRIGLSPLTTSFSEVFDGLAVLARLA